MRRSGSRRAVLLAGATGRLGRAIALRLAREGFDLALAFRRRGRQARALAEACAARGPRAAVLRGDLLVEGGPARLASSARRALGRLDGVVCAVGEFRTGRARDLGERDLRLLLASNLEGPFALARACLRRFPRGGGRIVFLGQAGAGDGRPRSRTAGYAAAKAGLLLLARSLAREVARGGATVNVVSPGAVAGSPGPGLPRRAVPSGRSPGAGEIAAAVAFLLSDEARSITGAEIPVSGGFGI